MKVSSSLLAALSFTLLTANVASAEMSLGTLPSTSGTTASMPQAGTSAGSPQMSGPLNSAPNGAGGTYGYPNSSIDPNTTNPGLPQPNYYSGPSYNNGNGTVSGTSTSVNPAGAPFVTPPSTTVSPTTVNPTTVTPTLPTGAQIH